MASPSLSPLDRQVARVSRRLYLQTFLDQLVWFWSGALVLASGWFFAQPYLMANAQDWLRWAVAGGLFVGATGLAGVVARFRAPSQLTAALSLDERFGLKERVTTSLTLGPDLMGSAAGQALLADVNQRIGGLDVTTKFPVAMSRSAFVVPVCAAAFACVAFLYEPPKSQAVTESQDEAKQPPVNLAAVDEKMKALKKKPVQKADAKPRTEEIERLEAKLEEIANRPRRNKEELRERYKEIKASEDRMRKREQELANKADANQQLRKLDKLNEGAKEGPAKDLQKALSQGNLDQAKEQLEKLSKKIDKMTDKEKQQLAKQLKDMEQKLKRLADQQEKKDELEKLKKEGKIDQEAYDRETKELEKQAEKLKDVKDLAEKMKQCKKCLEKGDAQGAQKQLGDAADQVKQMQEDEETLEDIREQMKRLKEAKKAAEDGLGKDDDDKDKDPKANDSDEPNDGGVGAGRRAKGQDSPTRSFETKARIPFDAKGKKIFDGYAPGQNFRKKSTSEIIEDIDQARQEASEAIEQQRIPKAARDMAKGYFKNLGGQADGKKPAPAPEKP